MKLKPRSATLSPLLLALLMAGLLLPACQRASQQEDQAPEIVVNLQVSPQPAVVGPATLLLEVQDQAGQPVQLIDLTVRGDMSHAGMTPIFAEAQQVDLGLYQLPFEWSMAGDWILSINAELADGRLLRRQLKLSVSGGESQPMEDM